MKLMKILGIFVSLLFLLNGCASVGKSLIGAWTDPTIAISTNHEDEKCKSLMEKNRDSIIAYLSEAPKDKSFPSGWLFTNKLREGSTSYRNLLGGIYLTIGINRGIEYNADQIAGLMDSPRKRADKDCEDCALLLLKQFPNNLLKDNDVGGVIFSMKHKVKEKSKQFGVPYDEVAEIVFSKEDINAWKNMEIGTSDLLKKSVFIVDGTRL